MGMNELNTQNNMEKSHKYNAEKKEAMIPYSNAGKINYIYGRSHSVSLVGRWGVRNAGL